MTLLFVSGKGKAPFAALLDLLTNRFGKCGGIDPMGAHLLADGRQPIAPLGDCLAERRTDVGRLVRSGVEDHVNVPWHPDLLKRICCGESEGWRTVGLWAPK